MSQPKTWKCEVCGYIHHGDSPPDQCPVCGVGAEMFSLFEVAPSKPAARSVDAWRCTICDAIVEGDAPPEACPVCSAEASLLEPHERRPAAAVQGGDVERIVILGAGVAGLTAAEQARLACSEVVITVISKETELPYYRLNLTRLLAGEVEEDSLVMQQASWFDAQRIELLTASATAIDRDGRQVQLQDGRSVGYDRLILAAGAHAFVPPIAGVTRVGVTSLRTKADARGILARVTSNASCVCVGGGLLGLETAGALARRGARVTVLEGHDWLLPRQLAEPAGRLLRQQIEAHGIEVRCGVRVEEFLGDEEVRAVRLADGAQIPADLVVLATGVRPNSYLARQCGLEVGRGVIVDDRMVTSDPAILAAGDIAEHRGVVYGIWPTAYAQGLVAGLNAAGGAVDFRPLAPSNRLKVLDVDLFSIGQFQPADASYPIFEHEANGSYHRFVFHDGRLVGANLLGDTTLAGSLKTAIEEGTQLAELGELLERFPQLGELAQSVD